MRTIFAILFMFSFAVDAQIKVLAFIETGYINERSSLNAGGSAFQYKTGNALYCDIVADFSIKRFHLEQKLYNLFSCEDRSISPFSPLEILYRTRIYYKFESLNFGYEHMCLHPIINQHNELPFLTRRGSFDKIFIRFTFKN